MRRLTLAVAAAMLTALPAWAADYTIMAPAAPGGGWDQTARTMQNLMQQEGISGNVQVTNVPGAGGIERVQTSRSGDVFRAQTERMGRAQNERLNRGLVLPQTLDDLLVAAYERRLEPQRAAPLGKGVHHSVDCGAQQQADGGEAREPHRCALAGALSTFAVVAPGWMLVLSHARSPNLTCELPRPRTATGCAGGRVGRRCEYSTSTGTVRRVNLAGSAYAADPRPAPIR